MDVYTAYMGNPFLFYVLIKAVIKMHFYGCKAPFMIKNSYGMLFWKIPMIYISE